MVRKAGFLIILVLWIDGFGAVSFGGSSEFRISEDVAVITELPLPAVEITDWDIAVQTDLPNNRLKVQASGTFQNKGSTPVKNLDFDLLGAEEYYGVEVEIAKIAWLMGDQEMELKFKRFMENEPKDPTQARTYDFPEVTRVFLSPPLVKGSKCRLVFDYTITCVDIKKRHHYNLIWESEEGLKETCLMSDFSWYPHLMPIDSQVKREMEPPWHQRNFFPREQRSTWRVTLTHPAGLEGVVIDGKLEKTRHVGEQVVSQWRSIVGVRPQIFIGPAERIETRSELVADLDPRQKVLWRIDVQIDGSDLGQNQHRARRHGRDPLAL